MVPTSQQSSDPWSLGRFGGTSERRNQAIEVLRLLAAFGIVAFHSPVPGKDVAYAGLAVFVILSPYLDVLVGWQRRRSLGALAKRLLVPWVFWGLVYGAIRWASGGYVLRMENGLVPALLLGTAHHLWFLPYLFLSLLVLDQAKARLSRRTLLVIATLLGTALMLTAEAWRSWPVGPPWGHWLHATPMFLLGVALGLAGQVRRGWLALVPIAAAAVAIGVQELRGVSVPYLLGAALVVVAVWLGPKLPGRVDVEAWSRCTMGLYLVHIAWLTLIWPLFDKIGFWGVPLAFTASLVSVYFARRFLPWARPVL